VRRVALTSATGGRVPIGEASDGFRWGPELRTLGEVEVRPFGPIGIALGGELQVRGSGSIIDPFLGQRIESQNVGAKIVSLTPAVRAQLDSGVFFSLTGRIPVYQDLVGLQFQQGPGIFAGAGYVFPVGAPAAAPPSPLEPGARTASLSAPRFVVREYGADWCEACKRLAPILAASRARHSNVRFEQVDVTEWSQDELARRVPGATALPVVEVLRGDGTVVARLEGENAFSFPSHLKETVE
jgi:thiol-disulfide isomerase/thioredoxin